MTREPKEEITAAAHAQQLAGIRAKIAEADADPRPSLGDEDVEQHFEERLQRSLTCGDHA